MFEFALIAGLSVAASLTVPTGAVDDIRDRVSKGNPTNGLCRFISYDANVGKGKFVINTNFWLRGVDFSCVSPWNSAGGRFRAGTAISKRHIIFAKHLPMGKGTKIVFTDDVIGECPCRIADTRSIDKSDIMIGLLDYELTPNIKPAKILPPNFTNYIGTAKGMPVITFNQNEEAILSSAASLPDSRRYSHWFSEKPKDVSMAAYWKPIAKGDSGNPAFLLVNNEPILIYCLWGIGCWSGTGPAIHNFRRQIQKTMDELCPGYKLEMFDFEKVAK